ncbi:hemicentin-1-like isoform X2 [Stylophora pistillata]|uniref:Cell adhesion molecule-related/down-regulated by oncogenes n=1 Tax=Stylophora pistillata TaxID=50429 RepID=A0A2B4SNB8_STYPI|nr:hemicentin-1-like isoform X2 [Stylophora pistillata]PFX30360.1 Hemicentin-1 [Stylophora pistillata]
MAGKTRLRTLHANLIVYLFFVFVSNWGYSKAQNGIPEGAASLVFVFDTTGSMYDDLIQVRAGAAKILSTTLERKVKPLYNYVLIPFHDPDVGPAIVTTSPEKFQERLDNLLVQGGGDCPEMSLNAIILALEISLPGSFIYVFTDANAKDFDQTQKVLKLIQQKQSQVLFVITGDCGNQTISGSSTAYELISAASSGQVFYLKKKDVNQVLKFVEETLQVNRVNLISTDTGHAADKTYYVPVDNALLELNIALSGEQSTLDLYHPDGHLFTEDYELEKLLSLRGAKIVSVKNPQPGLWKLVASSNGSHTLRVTGFSSMSFTSGFGVQPIKSVNEALPQPVAGFRNFVLVKVHGLKPPGRPERVEILDLQGGLIGEVPFSPQITDEFTFDWENFEPPKGLFYLRVIGVDDDSNVFYRASPTALSAVLPDPPIVTAPASIEVLPGPTVELWCSVQTGAPAKVQWIVDRRALGPVATRIGSANVTYIITSVTSRDHGPYTCFASNVGGTARATTTVVVKVPRPVVINQNTSLTLVTGDAVSFSCAPDVGPPFKVVWRKDGSELTPQANNSLLLHIQRRNDSGRYECIATNTTKEEVLVVDVVVYVQPSVTVRPPTKTFRAGNSLSVKCQASGFPAPTIMWYREGFPLELSERIIAKEDGELVINNAQLSDVGDYECIAWNIAGQSQASLELLYTVPPSVFVDREEVTANAGETITIHCTANGTPRAKITWYKGQDKITASRRIAISSQGHLVINAVGLKDGGYYTCLGNNTAGEDSVTISIQVQIPPRVSVDYDEVPVILGDTLVLQCAAVGVPMPTITWVKDDKPLKSNDRINITDDGTLIIRDAIPQDVGEYHCVGRSPAGTDRALVILWGEGVPASITTRPSDKTVTFGGNVTFTCRAEGVPQPRITWQNSLGIAADADPRATVLPSGDLFIQDIELKDAGRYVCNAENRLGRDSVQVTLILTGLTPPAITKPDKTTIITDRGKTVKLRCPAIGNPRPTITWQKNRRPISIDGVKFKQADDGSLVISSLLPFDSGTYLCTAKNPTGQDFLILTLYVYISPEIIRPPPNLTVDVGDSILMECVARGFPIPRIRWFLNKKPLPYNGSVIEIANLSVQHTGVYLCVAENMAGNDTATATLSVMASPSIEPMSPVKVTSERWTELKCNASGNPKPKLTWLRQDVPIGLSNPKYLVLPSGSLRIFEVKPSDSGTYTCVASNPLGVSRQPVELFVQVPPEIIKRPENISINEGDTIILECEVRGFPVPRITWYRNGSVVLANVSLVEITEARKSEHEGMYRCEAENPAGNVTASAWVAVKGEDQSVAQTGRPEFVHTPQDTIVDEGATFVWDCTAAGKPTPFLLWAKDGQPVDQLEHITVLANNSLVIKGVKSDDGGQYQCSASNGVSARVVQAMLTVRVNGNWNEWQEWDLCSSSCGSGYQYRYRLCDNPAPSNGGKFCPGNDVESQLCNVQSCPVNGNWSTWTDWTLCSKVCNGGEQTRSRECNNPAPQHGGNDCLGDKRETRPCNLFACPDGVGVAIGQVHGTVNNVMLPTLFLLANLTKTPTNETQVSCSISGLPGPIRNWLKTLSIPLTAPIYWATAEEKPNAENGLTITKGRFVYKTWVHFSSGETMLIEHDGKGVNEKGVFVVDVVIKGKTPKIASDVEIKFPDFAETFVQTDVGEISSASQRVIDVNGKPFPFSCNSTILYSPDDKQRIRSLSQTVQVSAVDYSFPQSDTLKVEMRTSIQRASVSDQCTEGLAVHSTRQFCEDIDECAAIPRVCSHFCQNFFGSFRCSCPGGHALASENKTCEDVDECTLGIASCPSGEECVNTDGSYRCRVKCADGFLMTANDTCVDIDECEFANSSDSLHRNDPCLHQCENLPGSYRCYCKDGYHLREDRCEDIDECSTSLCDHGCANAEGGYTCFCFQGYRYVSDNQCVDVNECAENSTLCGSLHCVNVPGSFQCLGKCDLGFKRTMDDKECVDLDECDEGRHNCKSNQMCMNTYGSFYCVCPRGYSAKTANSPCKDVDECKQFQGICEHQCVNTIGSFECRCPGGGILNPDQRTCSGVDGCALENLKCEQQCDFTAQGFKCSCSRGYRLADNKQDCIDVDECSSNSTNSCQYACINTLGGYRCQCPVGYHLSADGKKCQDVDECALTGGPCNQNQCYNTRGSYQCLPSSCPRYYNNVRSGFCVNQCSTPGYYCTAQATRQEVFTLPLGFPANTDVARLIPFFPPYMASLRYYCQFQYVFSTQPSPFGIRMLGNEAVIYTKHKLEKADIHQLQVTADLHYMDGTLACRTVFTVYIDISKFSF